MDRAEFERLIQEQMADEGLTVPRSRKDWQSMCERFDELLNSGMNRKLAHKAVYEEFKESQALTTSDVFRRELTRRYGVFVELRRQLIGTRPDWVDPNIESRIEVQNLLIKRK